MKRHTGSTSMEAQEEVEQNRRNESKRLKLIHNKSEGDFAHTDAGPSHLYGTSSHSAENIASQDNYATQNVNSPKHNNGFFPPNLISENSKEDSSLKTNGNEHPTLAECATQEWLKQQNNSESFENPNTAQESSPNIFVQESPPNIFVQENPPILVPQESLVNISPQESSPNITAQGGSPDHMQQQLDEAIMNGNMNMTEAAFQLTMPKNILEDSNGGSSQSDTDIENSPSPGEVNKGNFSEEALSQDRMSPKNGVEAPGEIFSKADTKTWNFDVENLTSSLLQVSHLEGHADFVFSVAADEDLVLSSSGDTTIKVWDVLQKKERCSFRGHSDAVTSVILLSNEQSKELSSNLSIKEGQRLAMSASIDCYIKLWSVYNGEELMSLYTFNGITCMGYLENQFAAVIGTEGGKLELWNFCSKNVSSVFAHEDSISDLQVNESHVYSASLDGSVKVWLVEENEFQPLYTRRRKEADPKRKEFKPTQWKSLAIHDDILYLGDNTSELKILDWRGGRMKWLRNQVEQPGISDAILAKNNILLSTFYEASSDSGGINVWQLPAMSYVCTITGDVQEICSLAMTQTRDGKLRIVSGGHQLLVWDFDSSKGPVTDPPMPFYAHEIKDLGYEVETEKSNLSSPTVTPQSTFSGDVGTVSDKTSSWCMLM